MQELKKIIAARQDELRKHRLFELIEECRSTAPLARMARALAWWPMVFQDVLRLNVERLRGTSLEHFAEHHRSEDAGHDRWFLGDLRAFGVDEPTFGELFDDDFRPVRDACYAVLHEVHREQPEAARVALLLALEPTGHVFFERVSAAVERCCPDLALRYFAKHHLAVEQDHDLFAESTDADLDRIVLSVADRVRSEAVVARIFNTFTGIFSYLADRMGTTARSGVPDHRLVGRAVDPAPALVRAAS